MTGIKTKTDLWAIIDILAAVSNFTILLLNNYLTPESIRDTEQKRISDYQQIVVMVITWFRFFGLFLLIPKVSKLLLTLLRMVMDTISFTFIIVCFTLIMATAFTIRFAEADPDFYGNILLSMRSLFDLMVTNWFYRDLGNYNRAHNVFVIFHVMITNVFLLNYLIALLSTVYNIMLERGEYSYKALKYNFYEKFKSVLSDESGVALMYINPPPLNVFSCLLLPFLCCNKPMKNG